MVKKKDTPTKFKDNIGQDVNDVANQDALDAMKDAIERKDKNPNQC